MNEKVIERLNQARARELSAIVQYLAQHYQLEDAMYGKLGDRMKKIGIAEMKHAEAFAERILFLGGVPTTKPDAEILKEQSIAEMLQTGVELEAEAVRMYNESARICAEAGDSVTKRLFETIAAEEEEHLDEFQNTANHIEKLGAAYLATLIG